MTDRQLKGLMLFLLESIIILGGVIVNDDFVEILNDFIYEQYQLKCRSLNIIFNIDILKDFVEEKYDVLTLTQIIQLIYPYKGLANYSKLVEEIGVEDDNKINELALLFAKYYYQQYELYYLNDSIYYPKGYPKILH